MKLARNKAGIKLLITMQRTIIAISPFLCNIEKLQMPEVQKHIEIIFSVLIPLVSFSTKIQFLSVDI